jgi:glutaredoxin
MVTVYSRQGCHLCENAVNILEGLREELAFEIEVIDISGNPELERLYGEQIPVIQIDGEHHDFWRVDPDRFRASLEKHRQRR